MDRKKNETFKTNKKWLQIFHIHRVKKIFDTPLRYLTKYKTYSTRKTK
ncbi:hypothetical protein [Gottschalkia purinilytica]|nr:hypothetical protein [Gottschalkia purinilytica]